MTKPSIPRRSLRMRLLGGTLVWIVVTIVIAGWGLSDMFRQHVAEQFRAGLVIHLDQLTGNLTLDSNGTPSLSIPLTDPRLSRPYSGLYWQVDLLDSALNTKSRGILRSRSLWDSVLEVPADTLASDELQQYLASGPDGKRLGMIERVIYPAERPEQPLRVIVAADIRLVSEPVEHFNGLLAWSLGALGLGLGIAVIVQVLVGLRPLGDLRRALNAVREGEAQHIEGSFPQEVQPLVDDFNDVLAHNARIVSHARTQAGNLAHAVKTPLTILSNAAARPDPSLPQLVNEQVVIARRQVDYHLAQARAAAAATVLGIRSEVRPLVDSLVRVMDRLYQDKEIAVTILDSEIAPVFRGDQLDLQEMLGNVMDNAWKWAIGHVEISLLVEGERLVIQVDDDGPGLASDQKKSVLARGVRADERVPGTGLGLAIVDDLARLYEGSVELDDSPLGGLQIRLCLPAAPAGHLLGS